jgi:hypothetical protein
VYGKGKGRPRTGHEGPEGKQRYSSILSLTSALNGCGWSTPRPGHFTPGKETRYPLCRRLGGWAPGPVWTGAEISPSTGIRSPDIPARSESLYRLRYPGPLLYVYGGISFLRRSQVRRLTVIRAAYWLVCCRDVYRG